MYKIYFKVKHFKEYDEIYIINYLTLIVLIRILLSFQLQFTIPLSKIYTVVVS